MARLFFAFFFSCAAGFAQSASTRLDVVGLTVTPHVIAESMRYRIPPEPADGARVQLYLRNGIDGASAPVSGTTRTLFAGTEPEALLESGDWAWHDMPSALLDTDFALPPGALTVWTFNGRKLPFGPGGSFDVAVGPADSTWLSDTLELATPDCWLSAVTFMGPDDAIQPDSMIVHLANETGGPIRVTNCRLWLPQDPKAPRALMPGPSFETVEHFNGHAAIPSGDRGGFNLRTGPLPLTHCALEVRITEDDGESRTLWAHVRIKPERFDISGGWVNDRHNTITNELFLKTLARLYVNTAHIADTPGYTDTPLYERYPLKYFSRLTPFERYDTDAMLKRIHAVEFLGEPQYGGGTPVPPQDVWRALQPYSATRLSTTLTNSEERIWRDYMGLSDYPHYDAYRVTAPSADSWRRYERWADGPIGWGAPLETIGDMCRSLREMSRPAPCAIWSQGPHDGWGVYGGRERTSPTPDEIRLQAYHAISTRITSLYWFNLQLGSLLKFPDTLDELGRIGRELRLIDEFLLEGDAFRHERLMERSGKFDWDIASVCGPRAALLFALDLDYEADPDERVFRFGEPRKARWTFELPAYLGDVVDVFRVDADGVYDTNWKRTRNGVRIRESMSRVAMYVATPDADLRGALEAKRQRLIEAEEALGFDPAHNAADLDRLMQSVAR